MKRYLFILIVIGLSLTGCSKGGFSPGPKGPIGPQGELGPEGPLGTSSIDISPSSDVIVIEKSGVLVTEEYPFTDFSQLEIEMFDVEISQGEGYSVVLEMDKNVFDLVQVTQEGETLWIGLDPSEAYHMENIHMRAEITMPRLTGLAMSLNDDGKITGFKSEDDLVIVLSKSSLRGEVHAGDLEVTTELGCTVTLSGSATDVTVKATVDSDVDLSELECRDAMVTAEVSSQVTVYPTGRLDAEASASKVRYSGDPTLGEIKSELGGSVEKQ
ncbi:MAG: DUF2807 domain-containing protein [Anaerolineales bacterium]